MEPVAVYLEIGSKRVFAGALEWPGWARSGRDESSALAALLDYAPRYTQALARAGVDFDPPGDAGALAVVERLAGSATTDFGAPDAQPAADRRPFDSAARERSLALLRAGWLAFDLAVETARGKSLRVGPRGGGRDLARMTAHVLDVERAYLARLAWKVPPGDEDGSAERIRQAVRDALEAAAQGRLPEKGPRGGALWTPRYYVRRAGWHLFDHAWELEDRLE